MTFSSISHAVGARLHCDAFQLRFLREYELPTRFIFNDRTRSYPLWLEAITLRSGPRSPIQRILFIYVGCSISPSNMVARVLFLGDRWVLSWSISKLIKRMIVFSIAISVNAVTADITLGSH